MLFPSLQIIKKSRHEEFYLFYFFNVFVAVVFLGFAAFFFFRMQPSLAMVYIWSFSKRHLNLREKMHVLNVTQMLKK